MPPPQATGTANSEHWEGTVKHQNKQVQRMKGIQLQDHYVFPQYFFRGRHFFILDAIFVHQECTQGDHVRNDYWGINATWG
jgi:hypothetical protein